MDFSENTRSNKYNVKADEPVPAKKSGNSKKNKAKEEQEPTKLTRISETLGSEKAQFIMGLALLLFSFYLLLALSSFIFTGKQDYSEIQNHSLIDYLFNSEIEVENWLGNIGAALSHFFVYQGFGISSFLFPMLFFLVGFKMIFKFSLTPMKKALKHAIFHLLWIPVAFGLIFYNTSFDFFFGQFGYQMNTWLIRVVGKIGAIFIILIAIFIYVVYSFNNSFEWFLKMIELIRAKKEESVQEEVEKPVEVDNVLLDEMDEDIPDNIEGTELEEELLDNGITEELVIEKLEDPESIEEEKIVENNEDVELSVEKAPEEEILTDSELSSKSDDFGPYDPTLDLPKYQVPPLSLLDDHSAEKLGVDKEELEANKNRIVSSLENYNIKIKSIKATIGPTVTLYEIIPEAGVRISKIKNLEDDIALSLAALGIRIIAPIPGKGTIGIEVPNKNPEVVSMKTLLASNKFQEAKMDLPVVMGKTISNESFVFDLTRMPHLLMAGATGQGKSVGLNVILTSLLYKKHPSQLKFVLVDPKKVELTLFNKIERHFLAKLPDSEDSIITDNQKVIHTLNSLCIEMDQRYDLLKNAFVRNIKEYNDKFVARKLNPEEGHRYLPYIVLVIDEFADLIMTAGKEVETPIARLAQLARAIGIHLIIATQRPSTNIITGSIKANFPARIAFRVTSGIDSRTILDSGGAEQLVGRGDMLLSNGSHLIRIQSAFVDTPEIEKITEFIGNQQGYPSAFHLPEYVDENSGPGAEYSESDRDELFSEAAHMVVQFQQGSASLLQRRLKLGYNRAGRIIDQLEAAGIIGPFEGSKARKVLVQDEQTLNLILNPSTNES